MADTATLGPRFYREGDEIMFENRIDDHNVIGPRVATKADIAAHRKLWTRLHQDVTEAEATPAPAAGGGEETATGKGKPKKRGKG